MSLTSTICRYSSRKVAERMICERVFVVSLREERHRLGHPFGRLEQPFAGGVFAQQPQDFGVVVLEGFDSAGVETLLLRVVSAFHSAAKIPYFPMECK